ncbi:MAG: hypothetical protein WB676_06955 [Bryobacteraceae bacterium]
MNGTSQSGDRLLLYLDGYIAALKDLRELLAESDKPPISALCVALDDKLAKLRRDRRALVRRAA